MVVAPAGVARLGRLDAVRRRRGGRRRLAAAGRPAGRAGRRRPGGRRRRRGRPPHAGGRADERELRPLPRPGRRRPGAAPGHGPAPVLAVGPADRAAATCPTSRRPRRHWMGTEDSTRATSLSRLLHACRTAMSIGLVSTAIAISIGIVVGGLMGYFAGPVDLLGMRLIEMFEAIPTLILMITLVAFFRGESYRVPMLMVVIGGTSWTGYARYLRAEMLRLRTGRLRRRRRRRRPADLPRSSSATCCPTASTRSWSPPASASPAPSSPRARSASSTWAPSTSPAGAACSPSPSARAATSTGGWPSSPGRHLPDRARLQPPRRGPGRRPGPQGDG